MTNALTHTPESATVTIGLRIEDPAAPAMPRLVPAAAMSTALDADRAVASSAPAPTPGPDRAKRWAVLEISDSGPGLSPKDAQRVFERFYRVEESRTRANGGSGLGLSIVAALTVAHGGTADVETALGKGSRFRIRLPLAHQSTALS